MELQEDSTLASRLLEDLGKEMWIDKPLPHVTELIYCLTKSYMDRFHPIPPTPEETLLFCVGVGLEKTLLKAHRQQIVGERDGIHYSIDFLDYLQLPGELKTTRISEKTADLWLCITGKEARSKSGEVINMPETWQKQVLAYLYCQDSQVGTLGILHLMGNYAPPFPSLRAWRVRATREELQDNWDWLIYRRDIYLGHVANKALPDPFKYCFDWECDWGRGCRYKLFCEAKAAQIG